ncbi:MAG: phosphotransferase [Gemmataceae bacterium]|nr:phosphotransferase [Gemmataceae bacterium]
MTPDPRRALRFWPAFREAALEPRPGGFSGARVWRVRTGLGLFCLRASPPGEKPASAMPRFGWMAEASRLPFVPGIIPTEAGLPFAQTMGRLWEMQDWMPGEPDEAPPLPRLESACAALALLHRVWEGGRAVGPVPAAARRLAALADVPGARAASLRERLAAVGPAGLRPCLCDPRPGNVLFAGSEVSGIVDWADMRVDSPAGDVARLLGELASDDEARWAAGMAAYRRVRPLDAAEEELARLLDRAGTLVAALRWERRLAEGLGEEARQRAERVLARVRGWG